MKRTIHILAIALAVALAIPSLAFGGDDDVVIPAGTVLETTLTTLLSAKTSQEGDPFSAEIVEPIFYKGQEVVPAGSMLEGHVAFIKEPGRVKGKAQIRLIADRIVSKDGSMEFPLAASLQNAKGAEGTKMIGDEGTVQGPGKSIKDTARESTIDAGIGAGVGAIAAGGTGALYGLGAGVIAGIIHNIAKHHKDLILPQGTDLTFQIPRAITGKKATHTDSAPYVIPNQ
jgi:hypothetical protein